MLLPTNNRRQMKPLGGRRHRGSVLAYSVIMLTMLVGISTLAVDYGHVQIVKSEEQSCADATALSYLNYYKSFGATTALSMLSTIYSTNRNTVDANSGVNPTITPVWGTWNTSNNTFTVHGSTGIPAIQVTVSRTAANNNAVPLTFGAVIGRSQCDVSAVTTAALFGGDSGGFNFNATASPYLAGMPNTTTSSWGDNNSNAGPYQVSAIAVTPGEWISFSGVSGTTSIVPGTVSYKNADGNSGIILSHNQNYDGTQYTPGPENGIADAVMPADAMMGVFLTNSAPNTNTAPAKVDWTSASMANKTTYSDLSVQAPFLIGNGKTTGGTRQKFQVPPGATRLYLAVWDGVAYYNNSGSLSGTITADYLSKIVQ